MICIFNAINFICLSVCLFLSFIFIRIRVRVCVCGVWVCTCIMHTACTAERFFRIDRSQETLHYLTDIATDTMYILDQELMQLPQTPDGDDVAVSSSGGLPSKRNINFSSGSSDNLERESHENTPTSPRDCQSFFNQRLSHMPMASSNSADSGMDSHGKCKQHILQHQYSVAHALSLIHTNAFFCSEDSQDSQNSRQNSPKLSADGSKDDLAADANVSFDRMVNFKR